MADQSASLRALGNRRESLLFSAAIILLAVALLGFFLSQRTKGREDAWIELAHSLSTQATELGRLDDDVAVGRPLDFLVLAAAVEDIDATLVALSRGDGDAGIPPAPGAVADELAATNAAWKTLKRTTDAMLEAEPAYKSAATASTAIVETIDPIGAAGKGLSEVYGQMTQRLSSRGASADQLYRSAQQATRIARISGSAQRLLSRGRDPKAGAALIAAELRAVQAENEALSTDDTVGGLARGAQSQLTELRPMVAAIAEAAPALAALQAASAQLKSNAANLIATSGELEQRLIESRSRQALLPMIVYVSGALALVALAGFGALTYFNARNRLLRAEQRDARQQQAILALLDEITNLADGDLTVDVTVTEDFTGAIADSINYTVQNMRNLVGTMSSTSVEVANAASVTQQMVVRMREASERQAREIVTLTGSLGTAAQSMQTVASRAEQLASQAQTSVEVAHNGADTVNRTISGMGALREQIQDTAKRIKRLGESSQEIGNIIEFINDIAEQTNTLALNASIQAAMAGEAGRGFAVVADEVQKLAERAGQATRQVETLVKTIQADTQEAITSMERSTQNVVAGARSAEEAGHALGQIEVSSQELATVITEISGAAREQSVAATNIAGQMQAIRDIAIQTSGAANQTARAVGELNTLSEQLRGSVAGFKLPENP